VKPTACRKYGNIVLLWCFMGMLQTTADMIQFVGVRFPCSTLDDQKNRCRSCSQQITLGKDLMITTLLTRAYYDIRIEN